MRPLRTVTAIAPGKVILFGEHAINRGQPALAASVGIEARCQAQLLEESPAGYRFRSGERTQTASQEALTALARQTDAALAAKDYAAIRALTTADYFAPAKYVLAAMRAPGDAGLELEWTSDLPASAGLGSGGAAFTALVAAVAALLPVPPTREQRAVWAHRGDILAHGGIASALDTQTSLLGGVIHYTGQGLAGSVPTAPGLTLVIGHTHVHAATSEVNGRVRAWLEERPLSRMAPFRTIGALVRTALPLLAAGNWQELGSLMNLNQMALERIGVSCPEIDRLIEAALEAGAYGAKLSGSGGGGIIIALTAPHHSEPVAEAIRAAGGTALIPPVGVPGVRNI